MSGISTVTGEVKFNREGGGKVTVTPATDTGDTKSSSSTITDVKESTDLAVKKKNTAKVEEYITGSMDVLPNSDFRPTQVYNVMGLGSLFSGKYYVNKVVHSIGETYTVNCEVMQVAPLGDSTVTPESIRQRALKLPEGSGA